MKKAFLTGIRDMELREVPEPDLQRPDDVKITVRSVGVCGSDLHYYRDGRIGAQVVEFPFAVGHECAGTVLETGPDAGDLRAGQRVAVDPLVVCHKCDQCAAGRFNTCRNQKFLGCPGQIEGSMAQTLVLPAECFLPIPEGMSFDQAVMSEPLAIAIWAVKLSGDVTGKTVAVLGNGPIGLCVIQALQAAGDCTVFATDRLDYRAEVARRTGAAWSGNPEKCDVDAEIARLAPNGVDLVFECAGEQDALDQAGRILTPGGTLLIIGIPSGSRLSLDMNYFRRRELTIRNVRRQNGCAAEAIDAIATGAVSVDPQITHRFPLSESKQAFDLVADYRDGVIKAMIHLDG